MAKKQKEKCPYCGKEFVNLSRHKCKKKPTEDMKEKKEIENVVFVGKRPKMNYVMACMMSLDNRDECTVKARGRSISRAVDVCEIVKGRFIKGVTYGDIKIETEQRDGKGVSSMEIVLIPPK